MRFIGSFALFWHLFRPLMSKMRLVISRSVVRSRLISKLIFAFESLTFLELLFCRFLACVSEVQLRLCFFDHLAFVSFYACLLAMVCLRCIASC